MSENNITFCIFVCLFQTMPRGIGWFLTTLCVSGVVALFTLPKVYETYQVSRS